MKLLFDIGNTRIKWAIENGESLSDFGEQLHRGVPVKNALGALEHISSEVYEIWVVNVAGDQIAAALSEFCQQKFAVKPQFVSTTRRCGDVVNGYEEVAQHGTDRWAAVVGAWYQQHSDICVVDAGTAVTIDLINADGRHQGGFILPGLQLMAQALFSDTSDIETLFARGTAVGGDDWFGNSTVSAVKQGAFLALSSAINEAARRLGDSSRIVLTGGDAEPLLAAGFIDHGATVELQPHLVLEGLRYLIREH